MVVTQDLEKNGEVTCYVFFFMVLTPQISRPTLVTFGPTPVYDRAVSGIDLGVSVNVIGFAKVLDDAGVTGNAEDLSFFDVDNVALSCGADSVAMLRRELMTAEPLLRARRARGILPHERHKEDLITSFGGVAKSSRLLHT